MPSPACIILAAGEGTRLKSKYPKALQALCGKPLVLHAIDAAQAAGAYPVVVVIGAGAEQMRTLLADTDVRIAHQAKRKGTGHAVMCAETALEGYQGDVLVTCADIPLVRPQTLSQLAAEHSQSGAAATVLTTIYPDPTGYGRVVRDEDGRIQQIIEHDDADEQIQ
ncbi:MAG: NTP transferase domain-containing protein, partial [Armatimonadetes bacterium]|nr:NTP transferase domain-containing protein [Armatimonadota bacterium]